MSHTRYIFKFNDGTYDASLHPAGKVYFPQHIENADLLIYIPKAWEDFEKDKQGKIMKVKLTIEVDNV
jgi:hypothetical protein